MRSLLVAGTAWLTVQTASSFAQQPPLNLLPPGEGREIVAAACTQCHGPNVFAQLREGEQGWRFQVYDMILRGAQVQPTDVDRVVNYLTASFGPGINVPAPVHEVALPDGPGKDLVQADCSVCHGLDRVALAKREPAEWDRIVRRMIFLGAPVSDKDAETITVYLDQKFGAKPE